MKRLAALFALALPLAVGATDWRFEPPQELTAKDAEPHFHHLDGAGRRHVAPASDGVAVAWEDDHTGSPQVYVAIMPREASGPSARYQLSDGEEGYEPAVVAAGPGRWLAAWEQDERVAARIIDAQGPGPITLLAKSGARQVTLAEGNDGQLAAVWAQSGAAGQLLEAATLRIAGRKVELAESPQQVAPLKSHAYQGYPAATWAADGRLVVAWEDRRAGHTRLYYSSREPGGPFVPEHELNEHNAPPPDETYDDVGLGSGVMRVMLAHNAAGEIRAIWLDKRNPASGYAVWGAASSDGGRSFGKNVIVQDEQGSAVPQWHAALAGGRNAFAAVWDDTREAWEDETDTGDVILSTLDKDVWSADLVVPVASGDGYQGSPAVALEGDDTLDLVWIARKDLNAPTRLFYTRAHRTD